MTAGNTAASVGWQGSGGHTAIIVSQPGSRVQSDLFRALALAGIRFRLCREPSQVSSLIHEVSSAIVFLDTSWLQAQQLKTCNDLFKGSAPAMLPLCISFGGLESKALESLEGCLGHFALPCTPTDFQAQLRAHVETFARGGVSAKRRTTGRLKGERIGEYRVLAELGKGSMGCVYKVRSNRFSEPVALKTLKSQFLDAEDVLRFQREIQILKELRHKNIVRLLDAGKEGSLVFYVMTYIAGPDLLSEIEKRGRIPADEVAHVLYTIADALEHLHSKGLIHRDIKPSNIILDPKQGAVIADFGIAKSPFDRGLTATGAVLGTPFFMSPEAIKGGALDARSDLFSLGMLAIDMLSGGDAFLPDVTAMEAMMLIASGRFDKPSLRFPRCPNLAKILDRLVAVEPDERYQDAAVFKKAILPFLE